MKRLVSALFAAAACSAVPVPPEDAGTAEDAGPRAVDAGATGVTFRLEYVTDEPPASIYVQASDYSGAPAWVTVKSASGERVRMFRPCDVCACAACGACGVCGAAMPRVEPLASGAAVSLAWGGVTYPGGSCGAGSTCYTEAPLEAGSYVATFCWGTEQQNGFVSSLACKDVPFEHPAVGGVVVHREDHAG